jgi:hypothetical protein
VPVGPGQRLDETAGQRLELPADDRAYLTEMRSAEL